MHIYTYDTLSNGVVEKDKTKRRICASMSYTVNRRKLS